MVDHNIVNGDYRMARFLKLRFEEGETDYSLINMDLVLEISPSNRPGCGSTLMAIVPSQSSDGFFYYNVIETPEQILNMALLSI